MKTVQVAHANRSEALELVRRVYSVVRVEGFKKDYILSDHLA